MNRIGAGVLTTASVALFILSWEQPAFAYIDPGAGSLLLQVLMGGLAGAAVVAKVYWKNLMARLGRGGDTTSDDHGEPDT